MNRLLAMALSLMLGKSAAAEWTYNVKRDDFDESLTMTAVLRGKPHSTFEFIIKNGTGLVGIYGPRFDCYPSCAVQIKFGDATPMAFEAISTRPLNRSIYTNNSQLQHQLMTHTGRLIVRAPTFDAVGDLHFSTETPLNVMKFGEADRRQKKQQACKDNAVNEDYATCMAKQ